MADLKIAERLGARLAVLALAAGDWDFAMRRMDAILALAKKRGNPWLAWHEGCISQGVVKK